MEKELKEVHQEYDIQISDDSIISDDEFIENLQKPAVVDLEKMTRRQRMAY